MFRTKKIGLSKRNQSTKNKIKQNIQPNKNTLKFSPITRILSEGRPRIAFGQLVECGVPLWSIVRSGNFLSVRFCAAVRLRFDDSIPRREVFGSWLLLFCGGQVRPGLAWNYREFGLVRLCGICRFRVRFWFSGVCFVLGLRIRGISEVVWKGFLSVIH